MSLSLPNGYSWDENLKLGRETAELTAQLWPNYLVQESDIPEPGLKFEITPEEFARRFPVWGIREDHTNELMAFINAVQLHVDLSAAQLPQNGWTFAIQAAAKNQQPNCLCLLVANVNPKARGHGFSQTLVDRAKQATRELGFNTMIAPVRPTLKSNFPLMPMEDYMAKRSDDGEIYDPWIRMHIKSGGQVTNVCSESVRIAATLSKWREWTGLALTKSGLEILPQGLAPLEVNVEKNVAVYCEPNVWVRYWLA